MHLRILVSDEATAEEPAGADQGRRRLLGTGPDLFPRHRLRRRRRRPGLVPARRHGHRVGGCRLCPGARPGQRRGGHGLWLSHHQGAGEGSTASGEDRRAQEHQQNQAFLTWLDEQQQSAADIVILTPGSGIAARPKEPRDGHAGRRVNTCVFSAGSARAGPCAARGALRL